MYSYTMPAIILTILFYSYVDQLINSYAYYLSSNWITGTVILSSHLGHFFTFITEAEEDVKYSRLALLNFIKKYDNVSEHYK